MLTARDALTDRLHGLTGGADDYLVEPASPWRNWSPDPCGVAPQQAGWRMSIAIDDLVINDDASLVQRAGVLVGLTETERRLLGLSGSQHRDRQGGDQPDADPDGGLGL